MKAGVVVRLSLLILISLSPFAAGGQEEPLKVGIVGSESGTSNPSYSDVMSHVPVQKLLLDLAAGPRGRSYLESALQDTGVSVADLETLGLIQRRDDGYVLHFTLFTREDVRKVHDVSQTYARSLAQAFLSRRDEIEALLRRYDAPGGDPKAVAYIVLGCFSLDWDGLDLTAEKNYRTTAALKPNGDHYIPWAEEKSEVSLQGVFWGSHNSAFGDVQFTSFGDHHSLPRQVLPDLIWRAPARLRKSDLPEELKMPLGHLLQESLERMASPAGKMLFALRDGEKSGEELVKISSLPEGEGKTLVDVLLALDYIAEKDGRYRAEIPVLTQKDEPMIRELRRIGWEIMDAWLAAHYDEVKDALGEITPMRYGVTYAHGFTQTWHWLFGLANRQLVEAGLFADPYAGARRYKGFIPTVFLAKLAEGHP